MSDIYYKELKEIKKTPEKSEKKAEDSQISLLKEKISINLTHLDAVASKKNDYICAFAMGGIGLAIILLLTDYNPNTRSYVHTGFCLAIKCLISFTTGIVIILQLNYYYVLGRIENSKWGFPNFFSSLFDTKLMRKACFEMIICAIHPFPLLSPELDQIGLLMIFRMFLFIRFLKYHSNIFMMRHRILKENPYLRRHRPIFGWKLVMKTYFYTNPLLTLVATYSFILLAGAFCIHVAERAQNDSLTDYGNSLYFTIVSCASIGYGDITPLTYPGKFIVCIFALIGITTLSLLVSVGDRAIRMRSVELFSVDYVSILLLRSKIANISATYLQSVWKLRAIMKNNKRKWPYSPEEAKQLSIFQQRKVAILIGKIKEASRTMHRYRIRELALSNFKESLAEKKEEDENEDDDEKENEEDIKNTKEMLVQNYFTNRMKNVLKVK